MLDLIDFPVGLGHMIASCMAHARHTRQAKNAGIRSRISGGEGSRTPVSSNVCPRASVDVLLERICRLIEELGLLGMALDVITNVIRYGQHLEASPITIFHGLFSRSQWAPTTY